MSTPRRQTVLLLLTVVACLHGWKLLELMSWLDFAAFRDIKSDAPSLRSDVRNNISTTIDVHHTRHSYDVLKQDELQHWGTRTYLPNRILCAVPTVWSYSYHKIQRIMESWGPFCDKLLFVVASEHLQPPPRNVTVGEVFVVNMTRSADPRERNIWNKVHNMWSSISDLYLEEYEWFLKVDDDTYLFPDHLRQFTQYYNPNIPRYFGHAIMYRWKNDNIVFNAGLAYVLSREALSRVSRTLKTMPIHSNGPRDLCQDESGSGDDTAIAVCLGELGILAENTLDEKGRQRFFPFQLHAHYSQERDDEDSWFWKYKSKRVGVMENCCVPDAEVIAAHGYGNSKQDDVNFYELHAKALATRNHVASIPPPPQSFLFDKEDLDFEIDKWLNSLSAHEGRPKFAGYEGVTRNDVRSIERKHEEIEVESPRNDNNDVPAKPKTHFKKGLSLAVLTHPGLPLPAVDVFRNMLKAFTTGHDASNFTEVIVYYDARKRDTALFNFIADFDALQEDGMIHKLIETKFEESVQHAIGALDPPLRDAPMYAIYQYLSHDCKTTYCAFMDNGVFVHGGGGLKHAIKALQQHPKAVFAVPPLGSHFADFSHGKELQQEYPDADDNFPYMHPIGLLMSSLNEEKSCTATNGPASTRHFVAEPNGFRKMIPLKPVKETILEQHEDLVGKVLQVQCRGTGYLLHPPPWHMGKRLMKACGIKRLQQAVDHPDGLAVDIYNNLIEQSWTKACEKYEMEDDA